MGNCFGKNSRRYKYDSQPFKNQDLSIVTISDEEPFDLGNAEYSSTHSSSYEEDEETFVLEDSYQDDLDDEYNNDSYYPESSNINKIDNLENSSSVSSDIEDESNGHLKWSSDSNTKNYGPYPKLGLLRSSGSEALSQTTIELRKDPGLFNNTSHLLFYLILVIL